MRDLVIQALSDIENSVGSGIWGAHLGCSVLAGILLIEEGHLSPEACEGVNSWLASKKVDLNFSRGLEDSVSYDDFRSDVSALLSSHPEEVHELGHDVIFSSYIFKALDYFDIRPWTGLRMRVIKLVRLIHSSTPGWITINGQNVRQSLREIDESMPTDRWDLFCKMDRVLEMEIGDMQLGHLLTHAHAIEMLDVDVKLKARLDVAFRKRVAGLLRASSLQEGGCMLPLRKLDPRGSAYWDLVKTHGDYDGHAVKYAYSFLSMRHGLIDGQSLYAFGRIVWPNKTI